MDGGIADDAADAGPDDPPPMLAVPRLPLTSMSESVSDMLSMVLEPTTEPLMVSFAIETASRVPPLKTLPLSPPPMLTIGVLPVDTAPPGMPPKPASKLPPPMMEPPRLKDGAPLPRLMTPEPKPVLPTTSPPIFTGPVEPPNLICQMLRPSCSVPLPPRRS